VWLTPGLEPFFGGTYFPPRDAYGRPGFATVLERVAQAWRQDRDRIVESSRDIVEQLREHMNASAADAVGVDQSALEPGFHAFRRIFDVQRGGFGGAPKFPRPSVHNFLMRYWARTRNEESLGMVLATLKAMAAGGMNDQLGGGFHRYSVDARWFVPHFEKMLYDQAQLAVSCLEAFRAAGGTEYAGIARDVLDYVLRDLRSPEGGFYSAEDADSPDPARPDVKREGAFYLWTRAEIDAVAGKPEADWFAYAYGVEEKGNVAESEDPHGEFTGRNILFAAHSVEETARKFGYDVKEVQTGLLQARRKLLAARQNRPRPHLDDKVLTAWNGLMISAFAQGGAALSEPVYADAAVQAAEFILEQLYDPASETLLRRWREGEAAVPGFLDDYAFFVQGLLDLYEAAFDLRYLKLAVALTKKQCELFEDRAGGGFYSTAADVPDMVLRIKEDYDGAEPSGNSIAVLNLLRLARMTGDAGFRESAERAIGAFASRVREAPAGLPQMLAACEFALAPPREVVVVGEKSSPDTLEMLKVLHTHFLPDRVLLLVDGEETRATLAGWLPEIGGMKPVNGKAAAYVCENYRCNLPVSGARNLEGLLQ
jgi:uncharacterized protein YyaL (SSP411 family)